VNSVKMPGNGSTEDTSKIRLVGTFDDTGILLFSRGYKNFKTKATCDYCNARNPMMHRYARAKKGEQLTFSDVMFCSVSCYKRRLKSPKSDVL